MVIIDNLGTNLYFQLHIYNILFENATPKSFFETSRLSPIIPLSNNNIRGFD